VAVPQDLVRSLIAVQNQDGGWSYRSGNSWTEPTAFALLALFAAGERSPAVQRGVDWLLRLRREDGAWPPNAVVGQSTWVTALVLVSLTEAGRVDVGDPAIGWILKQTGRDTTTAFRIRRFLLGLKSEYGSVDSGWPWFPGAAAWVFPTAITILALRKMEKIVGSQAVRERILEGRRFLLSRVCGDGGWNHGSSRALGYESDSYPETTGVALLSLADLDSPQVRRAISRAERHVETCRSGEAMAWLRLALLAHGKRLPAPPEQREPMRHSSTVELALWVILRTAEGGRNVFLS
jgi:hypothetical protein